MAEWGRIGAAEVHRRQCWGSGDVQGGLRFSTSVFCWWDPTTSFDRQYILRMNFLCYQTVMVLVCTFCSVGPWKIQSREPRGTAWMHQPSLAWRLQCCSFPAISKLLAASFVLSYNTYSPSPSTPVHTATLTSTFPSSSSDDVTLCSE